jgi:hypothetical protein
VKHDQHDQPSRGLTNAGASCEVPLGGGCAGAAEAASLPGLAGAWLRVAPDRAGVAIAAVADCGDASRAQYMQQQEAAVIERVL